ncbi:hypothetical protein ACH5RR_029607 [Cinchona calisaya]|uniref:Uncharacterized protein n=1 Tax=Cinchona calisaya TaxID=153742 RepID=A0ABD2YUF8_9GENT
MANDDWKGLCLETCVYGKCTRAEIMELWEDMRALSSSITTPCVVGGNFNVLTFIEEYIGRSHPDVQAMEDFNTTIHDCYLLELPFSRRLFTWTGNRQGRQV